VGCYLGYLFRDGHVTGTSIRPYLAAIRAAHTRAGFVSPTEDPVISSLRRGFKRATAERVASRLSSVALPAVLGRLALTCALHLSRPSTDAAIAVGFILALRPMSIRGLHPEDINITPDTVFIRLRREKGNAGQRTDRVLRVPVTSSHEPVFQLFTLLSRSRRGKALFSFDGNRLNRGILRLGKKGAVTPPPLGRFTCRSLRSGCISAAHAIGVPLPRIMALSGHSSSQVLIRHYLDASIAPCSSARELFGRFLAPASS
jgi:integrase